MTDTVPSSGLSAARVEEIQRKLNYYWLNAGDSNSRATLAHHAPKDISDLLAEVRRLQGENARIAEERETYRRAWNRSDELLASAREETAQAVREEREACAKIADDVKARCEHWSMQEGYANAGIIADEIRSRSHPAGGDHA